MTWERVELVVIEVGCFGINFACNYNACVKGGVQSLDVKSLVF